MALISEDECLRRINMATADLRSRLSDECKRADLAEFRLQIAEWAVKGVMHYNVNLMIAPSQLEEPINKMQQLAHYLARNTAHQFLQAAHLAFNKHANYYELMSKVDHRQFVQTMNSDEEIPGRPYWPHPKGKPLG